MTKIKWPPNLVEDLASRRCVVFLGSGISATSQNSEGIKPKTWGKFLELALELIEGEPLYYDVKKLIEEKKYLLALQTIYEKSDRGRYVHLLEQEFKRKAFEPSRIHHLINTIDAKIVITTNFDKIYEKVCNYDGYCCVKYNDTLCLSDHIRSDNRLIIKAHGDIDDVSNIVFTRKQYFDAKNKYRNFYKILEAIFITNTVLFLGYSLDDPDIQLLLENVKILTKSIKPHYLVDLLGKSNSIIKDDWKNHYNVEILEYGPNHDQLEENLKELSELVIGERLGRGIV